MRSRRSVAKALETVADFEDPRPRLEQYLTPPELAAHVCHLAALRGDLTEATVLDLGCGTGMLALGARHDSPERIVGVDIDRGALGTAVRNERRLFDRGRIDWVQGDVSTPPLRTRRATVLSNPPFGAQTESRHADRTFLRTIRSLASVSYTIHNEGSRTFVESFTDDHDGTVTDAFEASIPVERRFDFHTRETRALAVEVFRIEWPNERVEGDRSDQL